jgi:hypothetical protein
MMDHHFLAIGCFGGYVRCFFQIAPHGAFYLAQVVVAAVSYSGEEVCPGRGYDDTLAVFPDGEEHVAYEFFGHLSYLYKLKTELAEGRVHFPEEELEGGIVIFAKDPEHEAFDIGRKRVTNSREIVTIPGNRS